MNREQTQEKITSKLKDSVFARIDSEQLTPRSRFCFLLREYGVWVLWGLTITVGAIVFAEVWYVSMHAGFEYYEFTHGSLKAFIVESLPYVWIVLFFAMVIVAYVNLRKTKHGYRYPFWYIVLSSLLFTVVGGYVLGHAGMGHVVDTVMGRMPVSYETVEDRQMYLWANPEDGRLVGTYVAESIASSTLIFEDVAQEQWVVLTAELSDDAVDLLQSGEKVRLVGEATMTGDPKTFLGCAVEPWMHEEPPSVSQMQSIRERLSDLRVHHEAVSKEDKKMRCSDILKVLMVH